MKNWLVIRLILSIVLINFLLFAKTPNHLKGQTSPYLKQHLYNPVDWYPWGKKAFKKAKMEHKLIFLSIGYSTCHWCHVMEEESFSDKKIAAILNRYFVAIKVDKEELPQIDKYYQNIYKIAKGKNGGWPLNIILDENKRVLFISTYIPPIPEYGSKGLGDIALTFGKLYAKKGYIKPLNIPKTIKKEKVDVDFKNFYTKVVRKIYKKYDKTYKGFGKKKKYPKSSTIDLLLDIYELTGNTLAKKMAFETLDAMIKGSIYDQIDGGFFRYTTDRKWLSPHFEKMLYSNAQILSTYIKAYKLESKKRYKEIVLQSIKEVDKHFKSKEGLYFSASDANSKNGEGGYYIYKYKDTLTYLTKMGVKKENAKEALRYLDISADGNFDSEFALARITNRKKPKNLERIIKLLNLKRDFIGFPFVDKKIITSWNAMMIKTKLKASIINPSFKKEALKSLKALIKLMQKQNGSLYHQTINGLKPKQAGFLEDYAYLIDTLLASYNETFDEKYLKNASFLTKIAIKKFYSKNSWYLDEKHYTKADVDDNYYTSELSIMIEDLLKVATYKSSLKLYEIAKKSIKNFSASIINDPVTNSQIVDDFIAYKLGFVIIKSNKTNLIKYQKDIKTIRYPFLLKEQVDSDKFLSCDIKSCFGYGSFKDIKKLILNRENPIE